MSVNFYTPRKFVMSQAKNLPYSLDTYFLANRNIPWFAIMFSIVAAETSTLTLVSIPGLAFDTNLGFLQMVLGYIVARVIISFVFIPQYFHGKIFTAYELIKNRFGSRLYFFTASLFLITRAAAEGVRVFALAIVLSITFGLNEFYSLAAIISLTTLYSFGRGLPTVIWTDVAQVVVYFCGAIFAISVLLNLIPGGWNAFYSSAASAHKFQMFDFSFHFFTTYTFFSGLIGGIFLTLASHGTDQLIVQRLLAAKNLRSAQIALIMSGITVFIQFTLFLLIGIMLWVFYQKTSSPIHFARSDQIFPEFIHTYLSKGAAIFMVIAILAAAMANLSAALNSLSSSLIMDFYLRFKPNTSPRAKIKIARIATIFWAVVLLGLSLLARDGGRVLELGLAIISVAYGSVLGVFLLGLISVRANQLGAFVGMFLGLAVNIYLWRFTHVPFTWYVFLGSMVTLFTGYGASFLSYFENKMMLSFDERS
jgi:SSS family solute:Na+ symporter